MTRAPQREPEKATRAPRRALGKGIEAKCSNVEQKVENIGFTLVLLMIYGASWVDNGSTKRARKGHESSEESSLNRHGSKM